VSHPLQMATHGWTGIGEILHGSVALNMLHRSTLPLLCVLPTGFMVDEPLTLEEETLVPQ
jgi:hypothetical protein